MWEVVGYSVNKNEEGVELSFTLYLKKPLKESEGFGDKVRGAWYRPSSVAYRPVIGDRILLEEEQRGKYLVITDIIVL